MSTFSDLAISLKMRSAIEQIALSVINKVRPPDRYGVIQSINVAARKCSVLLTGDPTPVDVNFGQHRPSVTGLVVRVSGSSGDKYISDVLNDFGSASLWGRTGPSSTSARGIVELATNAETQTGSDGTRAVTPAGLASRTATETRTGVVELATAVETHTGTDTTRAITPAGLQARETMMDTGWVGITDYRNSWSQYNSSYPAQYRAKNGVTYLRGLIQRTAGAPAVDSDMFAIPVAYAPSDGIIKLHLATVAAGGGWPRFAALPSGVFQYQGGHATWVSIDNVSFPNT